MRDTRRNTVKSLVALTTLSLAGCTGSSDDGSGGSNDNREQMLNREVEIAEDDYKGWTFSLNHDATLEYEWTVRQGPEIDIFILKDSEYDHLRSGNRFHAKTSSGSGGSDHTDLSSDKEWAFVIDNSNAGNASPPTNFDDDVATVEVNCYIVG